MFVNAQWAARARRNVAERPTAEMRWAEERSLPAAGRLRRCAPQDDVPEVADTRGEMREPGGDAMGGMDGQRRGLVTHYLRRGFGLEL